MVPPPERESGTQSLGKKNRRRTPHFRPTRGSGVVDPIRMFAIEAGTGGVTFRIFMTGISVFRSAIALSVLGFLASCAEVPVPPSTTAASVAPTPPPGYWADDGLPGAPKIVVSISEQRAYFFKGKRLIGESTVSTGKAGFSTPPGQHRVVWKNIDHISSRFGNYVDDYGNVVKSNVDSRKDSRPPGTRFDGAPMPFAMFFRGGYAMHQGYVPPYAASHGCIRLPREMAEAFFNAAPYGTPVIVKQEAFMRRVTAPAPPGPTAPGPVVVQPSIAAPPVRPAYVRSTVPASAPAPVRSTSPAPVRPTYRQSTVPAPASVRASAPAPVRSPSPAPIRPTYRRSTIPAPASVRASAPAPVRSPSPAPVRRTSVRSTVAPPASARPPAPPPVRSPAAVRSTAPASIRPTPVPVLSRTPGPGRARVPVRPPAPSPTPTPARR